MTDEEIKDLYIWFHKHPELAYQEVNTTEKIIEVLQKMQIKIVPSKLKTGVIAVIEGEKAGKKIALRADIDGLPIKEETGVFYASQNEGKMHACGHDFHMTAVLATAEVLQQKREQLTGTIYIIFQPAEEAPGGARDIIESVDVFANIDAYIGIHATPELEVGTIGITEGGVMASVDRFQVSLNGSGTHAAAPHLGNNPIPVMSEIIQSISMQAAKNIDPLHPHVVTVTHAEAGNTWNIIPERAYFEGTVRCFDEKDRKKIRENIYRIVQKQAESENMKTEIEWYEGPGCIINDKILCKIARESASETGFEPFEFAPAMISDDFSFYLQQGDRTYKGIYLRIGTGVGYPLHHPKFQVEENILYQIFLYLSQFILNILS